jgi:hydrogenase maturation protease
VPPFLVLAYGNTLRTDDGFAWRAAEALAARLQGAHLGECVFVRTLHQLTPELSEDVAAADGVVFLDARMDGVPGELHVATLGASEALASSFAHSLTPAMLVSLADLLFGRKPRAALVTVTGESFELGEGLSPIVAAAVDLAVGRVVELIQGWKNERD